MYCRLQGYPTPLPVSCIVRHPVPLCGSLCHFYRCHTKPAEGLFSCNVFPVEQFHLNYTLQQLKDRVETLIEQQGETAYCAAWIYTAEDCQVSEGVDSQEHYPAVDNPVLASRIFDEVGNIDYIYQVIQECVDEVTEEKYMLYQQELEDESPLVQ